MKNFRWICTLLSLIISTDVFCQTNIHIPPHWLSKLPIPSNDTFVYEVQQATAQNLNIAKDLCLQNLISNSEMKNGALVISDKQLNMQVQQHVKNGIMDETVDIKGNFDTKVKTNEVLLFVNKIDEYWIKNNHGEYELAILFAKSELGRPPLFDNVYVTSKYGAKGLWRSAIVPGWGQFHKHSYLKGGLILGGTAVLAGGIIFTEVTRADYAKKITMTHDKKAMATYANRRNNFALARNICIGATAALYIYNLVDAIVAPGARYVKVQKVDRNGRSYAFAPTVTYEGAPAATMAITF